MSVVAEAVREQVTVENEMWREVLYRLDRIEEDLRAVRALLEEAEEPVMLPMPDGSQRPFRPTQPVSRETRESIRRAVQLARELRELPEEERRARFIQNLEQARADAIARGIAIDEDWEAAIGD